jgi:outer membrane protein TolC
MRFAFRFVVAVCWPTLVWAQEPPSPQSPWPQPLTLEFVLAQVDETHPDLELAQAAVAQAQALQLDAQSRYGLNASLVGQLRWVDPPDIAPDQSQGDHRVSLTMRQRLYDFGRTSAQAAAADAALAGSEARYRFALNQYRLAVMAAFFDVLLADLEYARDDEGMATAYVQFDRARQRNRLGQVSDIDLAELETAYQSSRASRYASDTRRRISRAALASLMNRPTQLPSELATPALAGLGRDIPDVEPWFEAAETNNTLLTALREEVESARRSLAEAEASDNPVLNGEVEISRYAREAGGYDNWRAGVTLDVPLITGGTTKAQTARRRAELRAAQARLEKQRLMVRQAVVEAWGELGDLKAKRDEMASLSAYRDLYLDRSRALYEQEVKTDLGDAMVRTSDARLKAAQTEFQIALTWARIQALLGQTVSVTKEAQP